VKPKPITDYVITEHAVFEMERRGLTKAMIQKVLAAPEQQQEVYHGRIVLQSRVSLGKPARICLLRVFVDVNRRPGEVVTAYCTSKISKYWKEPS
jgi:hypothetical protein